MTQMCTDCDICGEINMCYHIGGGKYCWFCIVNNNLRELYEEQAAMDCEIQNDMILEQQELEDFEQVDEYFGHFGE